MTATSVKDDQSELPRALPIGRILRLLLGGFMVLSVIPFFLGAGRRSVLEAVGTAIGLVLFYSLLHIAVSSFLPRFDRRLGAVLAVAPVLAVFLLGGAPGQVGSVSFVGVSLLLAGIRADAGCEVMSVPGIVFGRRTRLVCLLFSPIDWVEERLFARA